jgi:hypothetical protein
VDGEAGLDRRILAAVTRRGRRLLTHAELSAEGASNRQIEVRCRRGTLQRIHDEVYLVGAGTLPWAEALLAGVLAAGETGAAAGFSAIRLRGLSDYAPRSIHVQVAHGTTLAAAGVTRHRSRRDVPTTLVEGIRSVSLEEALLQVAAKLPAREIHRLLTTAWRKGHTSPRKVLDHLERHGGRGVHGTVRLREVAKLYDGTRRGPGSEAEADFLHDLFDALAKAGIERPELQHVIEVRHGTERLVPDFTWPRRRKVIEMKGLEAHGDYVIQDEDNEREEAIRAAGWDLATVTPRAVRERRARTIARLVEFLQTPTAHALPIELGAPTDGIGRPTRPER